jgi:hypothetical protein
MRSERKDVARIEHSEIRGGRGLRSRSTMAVSVILHLPW